MNEEILSHFWRLQRFRRETLCTADGEPVQVIYPGLLNSDAGPDFLHARIKIGDTLWVGNVELHTRSSDWLRHGHTADPSYQNLILHVVFEKDAELGLDCPELELKEFIDPLSLSLFQSWRESLDPIPCQALLKNNVEAMRPWWLERLLIERLEGKARRIENILRELNSDWEAAFYQWLGHYFGLRVNVLPFEMTLRSIPTKLINKYRTNREEIEALLMGQAGMLQGKSADGFQSSLCERYRLQRAMFGIESSLPIGAWKYSRLRPASFPTVRLSQFADFLFHIERPLSAMIAADSIKMLDDLLKVSAHEYWELHAQFGQVARKIPIHLGSEARQMLIGNAILPFLFVYAEHWSMPEKQEWIVDAYRHLAADNNRITRRWKSLGIESKNFAESQALLQLSTQYCEKKRCLQCETGIGLMNRLPEEIIEKEKLG